MNQLQSAYAIAESEYNTFCMLVNEGTKDLDWETDFDAAFDRCEEIRNSFGGDKPFQKLLQAEKELVEWGLAEALKIATTNEQKESIKLIQDNKLPLPSIRKKIVEICMRLA